MLLVCGICVVIEEELELVVVVAVVVATVWLVLEDSYLSLPEKAN